MGVGTAVSAADPQAVSTIRRAKAIIFFMMRWKNGGNVYMPNTICYTAGKNKGGKMSTVKTAISLEKPLLEQIDSLAQEMGIPRSRLFVIAMESFLEQHQNKQLVEAINQVYTEHPLTPQEETYLKEMQALYTSGLEAEEW